MKRYAAFILTFMFAITLFGCSKSGSVDIPTNPAHENPPDTSSVTKDDKNSLADSSTSDDLICALPNESFKMDVLDGKLYYSLIMSWPKIHFGTSSENALHPIDDSDGNHQMLFRLLDKKEADSYPTDCLPDYYMLFESTERSEEYRFQIHSECGTVQVFRSGSFLCTVKLSEAETSELLSVLAADVAGFAGKNDILGCYKYEQNGFGGDFTITINENGTFSYYEGSLSSYIGMGTWVLEGDELTLQEERGDNLFRRKEDTLVFIAEHSKNFTYLKINDGSRFYKFVPTRDENWYNYPSYSYALTIIGMFAPDITLEAAYSPGETVVFHLPTITEHYYVVTLNGQAIEPKSIDMDFTSFSFTMPCGDSVLEINSQGVEIPNNQ